MKKIIFYILLILSLSVVSTAQVKTDKSQYKKFADALETQISCGQKPKPIKVVRALQNAGLISRNPYNNVDSVSFFRVKKPLYIWGFKVSSVSGFDYNSKIFGRGPGTSPGIWLGIVVPYSVEEVKAKLKNLNSQKINIDEATDEIGLPSKPHVRTEIACIGW